MVKFMSRFKSDSFYVNLTTLAEKREMLDGWTYEKCLTKQDSPKILRGHIHYSILITIFTLFTKRE